MLNIFPQILCSGDTIPINLTFTDKATGNPYNLTGNTVGLTVKTEPEDSDDTLAAFHQDMPGDATGKISFSVSPLEAGTYWLDVKMWTGTTSGPRTTVIPPLQFNVIQSVTTR
jgi:hypothetical protein